MGRMVDEILLRIESIWGHYTHSIGRRWGENWIAIPLPAILVLSE